MQINPRILEFFQIAMFIRLFNLFDQFGTKFSIYSYSFSKFHFQVKILEANCLYVQIHMSCIISFHSLSLSLYIYIYIYVYIYLYTHTHTYIYICVGRVFANGVGYLGWNSGRVIPKIFKMVLDISLLKTQQYKVYIKGKVEQSRERSSALPYTLV